MYKKIIKKNMCKIIIFGVVIFLLLGLFSFENGIKDIEENYYNVLNYDLQAILYEDELQNEYYDYQTWNKLEYRNGFQVGFTTPNDRYSEKEYNELINKFINLSSDGRIAIEVYNGKAYPTFNITDFETAMSLSKQYKQISLWDWEDYREIFTSGANSERLKNNNNDDDSGLFKLNLYTPKYMNEKEY